VSARDRILVTVLAAVAALAGFWFVVVGPKRHQIAAADAELATQQQRLDQAQSLLANAEGAKGRYTADHAAIVRLGKAVPADDNMASLVYDLQSVARSAKVTFRSIKLGGASGAAPSSTSGSAGAGASTSTSAPATQVAAAALPPGATVGTAGLATLPFSFVFQGSFLDMQRFLARVDRFVRVRGDNVLVSGRLLTVDGISLTNGTQDTTDVKASIVATAYLAPGETGATGAATAPGTTPSTGTESGTGTASPSNTTTAITAAPTS
jgi:Tfp pilus assembly protein PilO